MFYMMQTHKISMIKSAHGFGVWSLLPRSVIVLHFGISVVYLTQIILDNFPGTRVIERDKHASMGKRQQG